MITSPVCTLFHFLSVAIMDVKPHHVFVCFPPFIIRPTVKQKCED